MDATLIANPGQAACLNPWRRRSPDAANLSMSTVLPMRDDLPKQKDVPAEMGELWVLLPE